MEDEVEVDERELRYSEAVVAFAGRVLDLLDTDIRVADGAAALRLHALLSHLQADVEVLLFFLRVLRQQKQATPQPPCQA